MWFINIKRNNRHRPDGSETNISPPMVISAFFGNYTMTNDVQPMTSYLGSVVTDFLLGFRDIDDVLKAQEGSFGYFWWPQGTWLVLLPA